MINIKFILVNDKIKAIVQWDNPTTEEFENGIRIVLNHFKEIKQVIKIISNILL